MKIYLLNPPFVKNYVRSSRCTWIPIAGSNWYPIFLAYATGLLEKNGHETKLVDAPVARLSHEDVLKDVKSYAPEMTVVYTSLNSLDNDIKLADKIKKVTGSYIVFVGPWCSINPGGILENASGVDAVIRREFDLPLLDLANGIPPADVKELSWKNNGEIIHNPDGEFMTAKQLDEFPFVTDVYRRHININRYKQSSLLHPFVDMFTARGCSWGVCTFCLWPYTIHKGAKYRKRSIENVIEELKFIKKELPQVKEIFFQDDTLPKDRAIEISDAIIENGLEITWSAYAKADLDFETLQIMKEAGCRFLHVGYETSNSQILKNVKKGVKPKTMEQFTEDAKKAGIKIHGDFVFGFPGETKQTILDTIKWAKKLRISDYQFVVPEPHPTTPFYEWLKENGYLTEDGKVNYPHLTYEELSYWRFKAYRSIYLTPEYITSHVLRSIYKPKELLRIIKAGCKALPNILYPKRV